MRILSERRFVRATAPHTPPPGPTSLYRTGATTERREEAGRVTARRLGAELARDVPLGSALLFASDSEPLTFNEHREHHGLVVGAGANLEGSNSKFRLPTFGFSHHVRPT